MANVSAKTCVIVLTMEEAEFSAATVVDGIAVAAKGVAALPEIKGCLSVTTESSLSADTVFKIISCDSPKSRPAILNEIAWNDE